MNYDNLRPEWFQEMKDESPSQLIYEAEILNIRPVDILNGFYPQLQQKHYYNDFDNNYLMGLTENYSAASFNCRQDNDINLEDPLILSIDWGVFLSAVVSQQHPNEYGY